MSRSTITYGGTLVVDTCWCGIRHAVPSELLKQQRRQHENGAKQTGIYCPLGHLWIFSGEAAIDEERRRRSAAEARARHLQDQKQATERSLRATKGHLTRMRKRIANGVCPVPGCRRSGFDRVMSHVAQKHPAWLEEHPEVADA